MIVTVIPATVSVPVLFDDPVNAATVKVTVRDPVPLVPLVIVIQLAVLLAVEVQPLVVEMLTLPLPPAAAIVNVVGVTVKLQVPAWAIVTARPATDSVPVRAEVEVFVVTV